MVHRATLILPLLSWIHTAVVADPSYLYPDEGVPSDTLRSGLFGPAVTAAAILDFPSWHLANMLATVLAQCKCTWSRRYYIQA